MAFLKRIHCRNFLYLTASYTKKLKNIHYNLIVIVWIENEKHGIMFHVKHETKDRLKGMGRYG